MLIQKRRFTIIFFLTLITALTFWTQSRYPALNDKAMMAESASVADTISMWPILPIKSTDSMVKKISYTSINWANDNKKGMSFGIIIGALILTLVSYVRFQKKLPRMLSTLYGFLLGSPLGVCVNCAAPVFKGVLQSRQAELAFAMMLSSPTMNIVVVTMTFTLFPTYMAITKILFTLITIFIGIPLLAKNLGTKQKIRDWKHFNFCDHQIVKLTETSSEPLTAALIGALKDFLQNFKFIVIRTVPLMLLAGILGASISHLVPLDAMIDAKGPFAIFMTALIGLILPVPIAFDIILTNALFAAGLSPNLSLILLCSLGIYSAYSFMITWTSASRSWAFSIAGIIFTLSLILGFSGNWLHQHFYTLPNITAFNQLQTKEIEPSTKSQRNSIADQDQKNLKLTTPPFSETNLFYKDDTLVIHKKSFRPKAKVNGAFKQLEGQVLGLDRGFKLSIRDYIGPFWLGRGTASGDFDQDGWIDVAFGSDQGIFLYKNLGDDFTLNSAVLDLTSQYQVYAIAFVDWNHDGWLDLFFTSFNKGNYVLLNENGGFIGNLHKIPNHNGIITIAPSFGDFNKDGKVDVFNANMALEAMSGFREYGLGRINSITFNNYPSYQTVELDSKDGESMASLASDINQDQHIDLYVSNDFSVPDRLYYGNSTGSFKLQSGHSIKALKLVSPIYSMSIDTGDLNNDLRLDILASGTIATQRHLPSNNFTDNNLLELAEHRNLRSKDLENAVEARRNAKTYQSQFCKEHVSDPRYRENCNLHVTNELLRNFAKTERGVTIEDCNIFEDDEHKSECMFAVMVATMNQKASIKECEKAKSSEVKAICKLLSRVGKLYNEAKFSDEMPQQDGMKLFIKRADGSYKKLNLGHPNGWTWSAKIADFDNDGYQDIFNVESSVLNQNIGYNVMLKNNGDQTFTQKQFDWNLNDPFDQFSFTMIDFDNDGDLDIIANGSVGPIRIFENQLNSNNSIAFQIIDKSHSHGLHAKITIETKSGQKMLREIKAGGGYQSFDSYRAYFGIGAEESIQKIDITLASGKHFSVLKTFPANALYSLHIN